MKNKSEILWAHYTQLLRKVGLWTGIVALVAVTLAPTVVDAATVQFTSRSATISSSTPSASAQSIDMLFSNDAGGSHAFQSFRFEACTSPLQSVQPCVIPTGWSWGAGTISVQKNGGSAFTNTYAGAPSAAQYLVTNGTGNTVTASTVIEFKITTVTLPSTANTQFYIRVTGCTDTLCNVGTLLNNTDFGAMALDTTQASPNFSETAAVQEDLTFCVGVSGSDCTGIPGSGASLALSASPMVTTAASTGTAKMYCSTNGAGGFNISYTGTGFTDQTSDTINSPGTQALQTTSPGTEQFGFTLKNTPPSPGTNTTLTTNYNTASSYSNSLSSTSVASTTAAPNAELFTLSYLANISASTHPGVYTASQVFVATATF